MKKIVLFIFSVVIGLSFTACEDPYANQKVASPTAYAQASLQDTTGFAAALKTGVSPLTILSNKLADPLSLMTCSSVLNLIDTTAKAEYKLEFTNEMSFAKAITIPITFDGKAGSDVKVNTKLFNDSIKTYNKNAVQRSVYVRLLTYIVKGGLKIGYTSKVATLLVTPNNYVPVTLNDIASLPMNSTMDIDVLSNDTDPEKDVLTVSAVGTALHGTVTINPNFTVKYTPTVGYSGADSFSYTANDGNGNLVVGNVDINVMAIMPYTATTPKPYYIIGMANGAWNNSAAGLGVSIYPMSVMAGNKYNLAGNGEFTFTGYFWASRGFKLIRDLGNWDEQWGIKNGVFVHNDGGSSDIKVAADGFYTITLNSITNTMTMIPAIITPKLYTSVGMIGEMNGWGGDIALTAAETTNNHIWYTTYTFANDFTPPVGSGGMKFRGNGSWDFNWGAGTFPVGLGTNGGTNIPHKAGTYKVLFNDIDGNFYFIKQ